MDHKSTALYPLKANEKISCKIPSQTLYVSQSKEENSNNVNIVEWKHKKQLQQLKKLPFHALATRNLTFLFLLSYPKWFDLLLLDLFLSYFLYVFICRHTYYVLVRTKRKTLKEEKKTHNMF